MDAVYVLPDDILRKQVCEECFNYLSVSPVFVNNQGQTICGRCIGLEDNRQKTKSLFNIVASGLHFKCVNHFNGCTRVLAFEEVQFHEKECSYEPQQCIYCSFSGNLSQIFNHCVKVHPDYISVNGIIPLPLPNRHWRKTLFIPIEDDLLVVTTELTRYLFKIVLKLARKELHSHVNQYAVKLYKSEDHEFGTYMKFNISLGNTVEKRRKELLENFTHCQILNNAFTIKKKELELQRRILDLRGYEEHAINLRRKLQMTHNELLQKRMKYDLAEEVIKKMSHNFIKCCKCREVTFAETFVCPKDHRYCKSCLSLSSFCDVCKVTRDFRKLSSLEEFTVSCDWSGCEENISIKNVRKHKIECSFRPYKCPLQDCNKILLSIEKFKEHWHAESPTLISIDEVICDTYGGKEYYWILTNDIYHLIINFDDDVIQAYVEEHDVLHCDVKLECTGGRLPWKMYKLEMSKLWGRYQINIENPVKIGEKYITCRYIKIGISSSWI